MGDLGKPGNQAAAAAAGPATANAFDGMNQGHEGIAQGHMGSLQGQYTGPNEGISRAAEPGGMEGGGLAAIIKMIFERFLAHPPGIGGP